LHNSQFTPTTPTRLSSTVGDCRHDYRQLSLAIKSRS